jgi:transcriptional regulator with XRE-family HTH domain
MAKDQETAPDEFASRLATKRQEICPNLTAFARQTKDKDPEGKGISRSALVEYERGTYRPGTRELRILCNALRVTPNFLIFGKEEPFAALPKSLQTIRQTADRTSKYAAIAAVSVFVMALEEDQLHAHLKLLEDSVKARKTEDQFRDLLATVQAFAEKTKPMIDAIESDVMVDKLAGLSQSVEKRAKALRD